MQLKFVNVLYIRLDLHLILSKTQHIIKRYILTKLTYSKLIFWFKLILTCDHKFWVILIENS